MKLDKLIDFLIDVNKKLKEKNKSFSTIKKVIIEFENDTNLTISDKEEKA